jgi:hypothetical protein
MTWEKSFVPELTHTELLLAFWASVGFKPRDFMTIGKNEKRTAWLCRVLNGVTPPGSSCASTVLSLHKGIHHGQDDQEPVD